MNEIEAVARAANPAYDSATYEETRAQWCLEAARYIEAIDRVRDDRRDEAVDTLDRVLQAIRSHAQDNWRTGYVDLADKGLATLGHIRDARRDNASLADRLRALGMPESALAAQSPQDECNCYSRAFREPMQHAPTCPVARARRGENPAPLTLDFPDSLQNNPQVENEALRNSLNELMQASQNALTFLEVMKAKLGWHQVESPDVISWLINDLRKAREQ